MADLTIQTWLLILAVTIAGILGILNTIAARLRDRTHIHNLKLQAVELRVRHLAMLRAIAEMRNIDDLPDNLDDLVQYLHHGTLPGEDTPPSIPIQTDPDSDVEILTAA